MNRDSFSYDKDIIEILKGLESTKAEYPPELLIARRKLFIEQLELHGQLDAVNELAEKDQKLVGIFRSLKALDPEYPPATLARRRSIFRHQAVEISGNSVWNALRSSIRKTFAGLASSSHATSIKVARASVVTVGIAMLAFVAFALYGNTIQSATSTLSQNDIPLVESILATPTPEAETVICKEGYMPPLCLAQQLDNSQNLTYSGNGKARPAVAKDTVPGYGQIHRAAYINDGLYGPGASWVSYSRNSWIKIDLGATTPVDTVAFSRDRLGMLNDGDPGRVVIAVATSDDVYADGNSSNDEREYVNVYDSRLSGFDGTISGSETVIASFDLQRARFIKITFENAGTAIDEVEAFISEPSILAAQPTKRSPNDDAPSSVSTPLPSPTSLPMNTATPVPTDTPLPVDTSTPQPVDTSTPPPADTATPNPTDPPPPADTAVPTESVAPFPVDTASPPPVDAPVPTLLPSG